MERREYTISARLKTEKLDGTAGTAIASPCNRKGSIVDGLGLLCNDQTRCPTEINVGGAITCGFNWRLGTCSTGLAEKQDPGADLRARCVTAAGIVVVPEARPPCARREPRHEPGSSFLC